MKTKLFVICALALCVIALVACAAPTPTATPVPPTPVPPTPTAIPSAPKPAAAPTVGPEVLATKNEDVLGVWLVTFSPSDPLHPTEVYFEHTADGARNSTFISGRMKGYKTVGKSWFEGGLYKIQYPQSTGEVNSTAIGNIPSLCDETRRQNRSTPLRCGG